MTTFDIRQFRDATTTSRRRVGQVRKPARVAQVASGPGVAFKHADLPYQETTPHFRGGRSRL